MISGVFEIALCIWGVSWLQNSVLLSTPLDTSRSRFLMWIRKGISAPHPSSSLFDTQHALQDWTFNSQQRGNSRINSDWHTIIVCLSCICGENMFKSCSVRAVYCCRARSNDSCKLKKISRDCEQGSPTWGQDDNGQTPRSQRASITFSVWPLNTGEVEVCICQTHVQVTHTHLNIPMHTHKPWTL